MAAHSPHNQPVGLEMMRKVVGSKGYIGLSGALECTNTVRGCCIWFAVGYYCGWLTTADLLPWSTSRLTLSLRRLIVSFIEKLRIY